MWDNTHFSEGVGVKGRREEKDKMFSFCFYSLKSLVRGTNIPVIGCDSDMVQVYLERVDGFVQGVTAVKSCLLLTLMSPVLFCAAMNPTLVLHKNRGFSLFIVHILSSPFSSIFNAFC